jgi:hypothetical protein
MSDQLKNKLVAASLTRKEYLTLRNTVRVLRGAGVALDAEQKKKVSDFQAVVTAYEEQHA